MADYTRKLFKDIELVKGEIYTVGWMCSETLVSSYKLLDYSIEEVEEQYKKSYLILNLQHVNSGNTRIVKLPQGLTLFICKGNYDMDISVLASEYERYKVSANCWSMYGDFIRYLISQVKEEDIVYADVEFGKADIDFNTNTNKKLPVLIKSCLSNEWWYNSLVGVSLNVCEIDNDSKYYHLIDNSLLIRKKDVIVL